MEKEQLNSIYDFLKKNREFNKKLQGKYYNSIISYHDETKDKVVSLLYQIANTQSQPKIDNLARFYKFIHNDISCTESFSAFVRKVSGKDSELYSDLFLGLKQQEGWGDKTSALFVKSIYHAHNGNYDENIRIWGDAPMKIDSTDQLKLPVDAVINNIFKRIGCLVPNFSKINKMLSKYYKGEEIEVWDDLWFWGFITQKGSGADREFIWNEHKYWSLEHADKNESEINRIKIKAEEFVKILTPRARKI